MNTSPQTPEPLNPLLDLEKVAPGTPSRLVAQLAFIAEIDRLKSVLRLSPLLAADRRENDAEHSWHLALMVMVLAEYANEPIDVEHTLKLVLVHDLVEIYAGDTCLFDDDAKKDQAQREAAAAKRLFALLPDGQDEAFHALWDEFEARRTPEARFAKAMDRLQPLLLNAGNEGGTWRAPGVTEARVRERTSVIADGSLTLWDLTRKLFAHGVREGWLAPGP
ncbi:MULTISPECIES: HD domain-containing protein [unclassified Streptomyces]|uniref:HD domain-containing protein n=1 Tax=unclassified Streptomyces TaxID=2593676 RepID=UPI0022B730C5|nr:MULTISPECIES: HD domain-containing protein [unclassified Streptomyces]MCZ7415707.1 HD domain-containing protein [Streptomyces sp. WMMC897]MCZ7434482.1 HD domain-containing protein [Streptomyces sp. WMMC1477]